MDRKITKILALLSLFCFIFLADTFAQTVTITNIDPGPYGQGSTIAVPFQISTASGCINTNNIFNLYLSDANGSFASQTKIGSFTGFYASVVNGVIPSGTPAGSGYKVRILSTNPSVISSASAAFTINNTTGVVAGASSQAIDPAYPEVFGSCIGADGTSYPFVNESTAGATATANFYNEFSQISEGTIPLNGNFVANAANYTVTVKAVKGGIVGTKGYMLINNVVNNNFGVTGSNSVCLNGQNSLSYNVDVSSPNGIQYNFPGLTYSISWGDGTISTLTICDIVNSGGKIDHAYIKSSCGNTANGQKNVFQVNLQPVSPYCGTLGTPVTSYAKVIAPPQNKFVAPDAACINTEVVFGNSSVPGQDPNSTADDCANVDARYTWMVDGQTIAVNQPVTAEFKYTFTIPGIHTVTLHLQNNNGLCDAEDATKNICIQNPPKPSFNLPATTICRTNSITPVNTSVIDANCNASNVYKWIITGPAPVSYGGGTTVNSANPNFIFSASGTYDIQLSISTASCGTVLSSKKTVYVNSPPTAILSPDGLVCGNNQTLTFDSNANVTKTQLTGTQQTQPTTYTWTVTGGQYSFAGGTNANSKYPQILFNDYAVYTVSVIHQNGCGTASDSQQIAFQQAPDVSAGPAQQICESDQATLAGSINGAYNSFQWIGGTGTFTTGRNDLNSGYIPSSAEISAGTVTLSLQVNTSLAPPCNVITSNVIITIIKKANVTSSAAEFACDGQNFHYVITADNTATNFHWVTSLTSGNASGFNATGSGNTINDIINNTGTTDAVITYTITPTTNGCPGNPFDLKVTVKFIPAITAVPSSPQICSNQPANIIFSSNVSGTKYIWTSTASTGISGNTNQTTPITDGSIQDVLVNNSTVPGTVTYTITPYNEICTGSPVTATVTVQPLPLPSNPGPDDEICNTTTYTLNGNDPSPGSGKWTVVSGQSGVTFSDDTDPHAVVNGLLPNNVYQFQWAITAAPTCPPTTNIVTITVDAETVPGAVTGSVFVCSGSNAGQLTLSGQVGNIVRWESTTDGVNWTPIANNTTTLNYFNITQTTNYRAIVQNGVCSIQTSSLASVIVNQPVTPANAGSDTTICNATTITLNGNDPSPDPGIWSQTAGPTVNIVDPANPQTQVTGLAGGDTYKFTWTIKGTAPCGDSSDEIVVTDAPDVIAGFTSDKSDDCGQFTVQFTNTSSVISGTIFNWDFGDGSPLSDELNPQHTFEPRTDGKDTVYTVSLTLPQNCVSRSAVTIDITVRPAVPIANILPDQLQGCGDFAISVQNVSPGNNKQYDFYVYDGDNLIQKITKTDKSPVTFDPITTNRAHTFTLYMAATDFCGNTAESNHIPITISPATFVPQMFVKDNIRKGCAPFNVIFVNNSSGGINFAYKIYNDNNDLVDQIQGGFDEQPYTFTNTGTYYVTITASNECASIESDPKIRIDVAPIPVPDFDADVKSGCKTINVNFSNLTADDGDTPASSLSYEWDFGDGSPHSFIFTPPTHTYTFKNSPYSVKLTVINLATGCSNIITKTDLINVKAPPGTNFSIEPDSVTAIPNYHFSFVDQTTGSPVSWQWSFGDGQTSTTRNPGHTYADTGSYKVTLLVADAEGCDSSITHTVQITGVPGQLYLPNAFMPDGNAEELKTFRAKGSGIESWNLQVYNKWGQLIWQTSELSEKGEPVEGWDGTFKGSPAPQGVYIWQATAKFINGTEWKGMSYNNSLPKRTGFIHLIR
ncbi:PKD domain-containing protein [Mucilaginibacter segetis]|uniref:PKD domain-containing protein n=1 Tax=Mucilaginibacter segetis TaxID=2793071 RepID=A0A934PUK7_9SPHI|nr:PKD domain-containing protein [Mucilaginibacter segetis]MBK0379421.1 PKD domain-containing protein [Mucilaginibacter segetis]